jgi:glutamine amidotransferase
MCVIVHQPRNAHLSKKRAKRLWKVNEDGGGFAFIDNSGTIQVEKSLDFKTFWNQFEAARSEFPKRDYMLHMRIATHGTISLENVHPFQVNEHTWMAHNGVIRAVPDYEDGRSDTRVFVDEVIPQLPDNWLDSPYMVSMVKSWIGWSKLMFLTTDSALSENVYIIGKKAGTQRDNMWFSNGSGVDKPRTPAKTSQAIPMGPYSVKSYHIDDGIGNWRSQGSKLTPVKSDPVTLSESELKDLSTEELWDYLESDRGKNSQLAEKTVLLAVRKEMGYYKPIISISGKWECFGCDEIVSTWDGSCECFMKVCLDCGHFAGGCICSTGGSLHLAKWKDTPQELQTAALHRDTDARSLNLLD